MAEKILLFVFFIPLIAVLTWSFFDPRESLLLGKRWMFREEPEPSEGAIRYIKTASAVGVVVLVLLLVLLLSVSWENV